LFGHQKLGVGIGILLWIRIRIFIEDLDWGSRLGNMIEIEIRDSWFGLGIWFCDCGLGFWDWGSEVRMELGIGIWGWGSGLGLGIRIGDWVWELALGIWDWKLGYGNSIGTGIEIGDRAWEWDIGFGDLVSGFGFQNEIGSKYLCRFMVTFELGVYLIGYGLLDLSGNIAEVT